MGGLTKTTAVLIIFSSIITISYSLVQRGRIVQISLWFLVSILFGSILMIMLGLSLISLDQRLEQKELAYNHNQPESMLIGVEYERKDWETTNTGPIDHLIYGLNLYDSNGDPCWKDGQLTLKIYNEGGEVVARIVRNFTENDIENPSNSGWTDIYRIGEEQIEGPLTEASTYIYRIEEEQIEGPVTEASTYTATYETEDGKRITSLVTSSGETVEEKEITGPY